jgi:Bacterial Ig-like domain (group 3)/FG-GAP-like repeat/FG-GAP repeat
MRPLCCRFAVVLPILTFCSVLAHAQGTTPSTTNLLGISPGPQITFGVSVRAGTSVRPPFPRPSGAVTIYNGTTAIGSPATLSPNTGFTSASFAQVFGTPDPSIAASAGGAVWGDFNEDGHSDLLVYGPGSGTGVQPGLVVQDFIANSAPSPRLTIPSYKPLAVQQLALPLLTQAGQTLAVLDVDGDGHLDLLAGNTVAYGNGDGTFGRVAVLPVLATGYNQTYGVDIDDDGKTDIVAVDTPPAVSAPGTVQYAFTVFHNNGGGSFTAMGPYPLARSFQAGGLCCAIYNIFGLSFADVNGDGRIDVLSQSNAIPVGNAESGDHLNVMLNLGPGFGPPKTIDTSTVPNLEFASTATADLNNDGKQDLIFSYRSNNFNNGVATLLGNDDGTFAAPVNLNIGGANAIGSALLPLITEDVDADGNADVVLGSGVLLLGKGDGTLTAGTPLFTSSVAPGNAPPAYALSTAPATASISRGENDPFFALVFVNLQSGADAVFIPNIGSGAEPTVKLAPGTYSLTAHYSGDATYAASISNTINLTVATFAPKVTVTSSANPSYVGQSVTFTATIAGLVPGAGGTVTFSNGSTTLGTAALSNGSASYTTTLSTAGNQTITAAYGGDGTDGPSSGSISQSVVVSPISFPTPPPGSTTLTVASGSDAGGSFTINAIPGYIGALFLTCSGLPANASCSFTPQNPGIAAPSGGYGIIVATSSSEPVLGKVEDSATHPGAVEWCGVSLLGLLLMGRIRRSRGGRLCLVLAAGVFVSLTGCGGSGKSTTTGSVTPPGTYTFQLNAATSLTDAGPAGPAVSQTYTLIVQ